MEHAEKRTCPVFLAYKDTTPDVEYTFNRLGKHKTVTDVVGTHTFACDAAKLRLKSEAIEAGTNGLYTRTISRLYEGGSDTLPGRYRGFEIGEEYETTYAYDDSGRLERVTGPGLDGTYGAVYARLIEDSVNTSDLVEYTYFKSSSNATLATIHRKYDGTRDLVDFVENTVGSTTVSKYDYTNDTLGRRTAAALTGSAFTGGSGDHHWDFGYNGRSELTGGNRRTGTTPGQGTLFTLKGDFDYVYDPIGNRSESNVDNASPAMTYTRNNVNQYTATSDPAESFTHDEDGNFKTDGAFSYTWDAENRLIAVQTKRTGDPVNGDTLVQFKYDYMSRRVEKTYKVYAGGWQVQSGYPQRFVYDEWNVALVLDGSGDSTRKYTWGLDLSGTIHGAGGIGGLLAAVVPFEGGDPGETATLWYFYDGNGNVGQILDATSWQSIGIAARYEYAPYGNVIASSGTYASVNPFRFSTKWFDNETGLGYWGYRYYSPRLGRWISRDPDAERGGENLYAFVLNEPTISVDPDGRQACTPDKIAQIHQIDVDIYIAWRQGAIGRVRDLQEYRDALLRQCGCYDGRFPAPGPPLPPPEMPPPRPSTPPGQPGPTPPKQPGPTPPGQPGPTPPPPKPPPPRVPPPAEGILCTLWLIGLCLFFGAS